MSSRVALLLCVMLSAGRLTPERGPEQSALTKQFLRVTKEVPAFGGITRENGGWVVLVLDSEQRGTAEEKRRDIFGEEAATIAVRVRAPRASASEQTMDAATEVLSVSGIERLDYDERTGYLLVGLVDVEAIEPAQLKLDELAYAYAYRQERGRVEGEGWSRGAEEGR